MEKKNLESTFLKDSKGLPEEIKLGEKVNLLNPEIIENMSGRRSQRFMNYELSKSLGVPPYTLKEIIRYKGSSGHTLTLLIVEGTNGETSQEMTGDYFCKYSE